MYKLCFLYIFKFFFISIKVTDKSVSEGPLFNNIFILIIFFYFYFKENEMYSYTIIIIIVCSHITPVS